MSNPNKVSFNDHFRDLMNINYTAASGKVTIDSADAEVFTVVANSRYTVWGTHAFILRVYASTGESGIADGRLIPGGVHLPITVPTGFNRIAVARVQSDEDTIVDIEYGGGLV